MGTYIKIAIALVALGPAWFFVFWFFKIYRGPHVLFVQETPFCAKCKDLDFPCKDYVEVTKRAFVATASEHRNQRGHHSFTCQMKDMTLLCDRCDYQIKIDYLQLIEEGRRLSGRTSNRSPCSRRT